MSQSLLLKVARQSITEVLETSRHIDTASLKEKYPVLNEKMATAVTLFIDDEIRSHYCSLYPKQSLIDDLIQTSKIAAFETSEYPPITVSEYLHVSIQISVLTPVKELFYNDINDLTTQITPFEDGIIMTYNEREAYLFPDTWSDIDTPASVIKRLSDALHVHSSLEQQAKISIFQIQNAKDRAILTV
jgi:AMMECR1 domain-containing protein